MKRKLEQINCKYKKCPRVENGEPVPFTPKREHQIYCCSNCRIQDFFDKHPDRRYKKKGTKLDQLTDCLKDFIRWESMGGIKNAPEAELNISIQKAKKLLSVD